METTIIEVELKRESEKAYLVKFNHDGKSYEDWFPKKTAEVYQHGDGKVMKVATWSLDAKIKEAKESPKPMTTKPVATMEKREVSDDSVDPKQLISNIRETIGTLLIQVADLEKTIN